MWIIILKLYIVIIYVNACAPKQVPLDRKEGSSCNVGQYNGTCLNMKKCFMMSEQFSQKQKPEICSFDGEVPIVCCTECSVEHVENIDNIFIDQLGEIMTKNGRKSWDKCIDYIRYNSYPCYNHSVLKINSIWKEDMKCHGMLVTAMSPSVGNDAHLGELPYMALLGYGNTLETAVWLCGGSLISESFILTAGHCTSSSKVGQVKYAALGMLKRSDPPELSQRYFIKRIIPYPEYKAPSKYHDIALLETATIIKFSWLVLPACLPVRPQNTGRFGEYFHRAESSNVAVAAGWGTMGNGKKFTDVLQTVTLDKFSDEECSEVFPPHRLFSNGYNSTIQLCFGNRYNEMDTCEGDSGGPLVVKDSCSFKIIGVTSFGYGCGTMGQPGMYTKVAYYVPWIESIIWP